MNSIHNIAALSSEVISKLRSYVSITSVSQCVEELALNAVDAGAKNVAVRLDLVYFKIQVVDNGCGMTKDQLQVVGERYHTSKCHEVEDLHNLHFYGFRGEALASLSDICAVMEITSRTSKSPTYFKAFHYGKSCEVKLSADERPSVGTTITIMDFMYQMPVRQKSICVVRDFEFSRHCLEAISLINPNVSFSLRNDQTGEVCLNTKRSNNILSSFRFLFWPDKVLKELVHKVSDEWRIQGVVSTDGHTTNDLQFIYVNKRLVLKTRIHQLIKLILTKHLFSRNRDAVSNYSPDLSASPKKAGNPVFALNITCPYDKYDICFEPRKTLIEFQDWDQVISFVKDALRLFLKNEGLNFDSGESSPTKASETVSDHGETDTTEAINTMNSKNALFSLIIKRPSEATNVEFCNNTLEKGEQDTTAKKTPDSPRLNNLNKRLEVNKPNSNCSVIGDDKSKHSEQNNNCPNATGKWLNEETDICIHDTIVSCSMNTRTIPSPVFYPVALRTAVQPSALSLLSNRKRKKSKLNEIKTTFQFRKSSKPYQESKSCTKPSKPCSSNDPSIKKSKSANPDSNLPVYSNSSYEKTSGKISKQNSVETGIQIMNKPQIQSSEYHLLTLKNRAELSEYRILEETNATYLHLSSRVSQNGDSSETVTLNAGCERTAYQEGVNCSSEPFIFTEPFIVTQPFTINDTFVERVPSSCAVSQDLVTTQEKKINICDKPIDSALEINTGFSTKTSGDVITNTSTTSETKLTERSAAVETILMSNLILPISKSNQTLSINSLHENATSSEFFGEHFQDFNLKECSESSQSSSGNYCSKKITAGIPSNETLGNLDMNLKATTSTDDDYSIQPGQRTPTRIENENTESLESSITFNKSTMSLNIIQESAECSENHFQVISSVEASAPHETNRDMSTSSNLEKRWIEWQDHNSGAVLYIDKATGNSSYNPPSIDASHNEEDENKQFNDIASATVGSHFFLSHNSTPFLPRPERKLTHSKDVKEVTEVSNLFDAWENPIFKRTDFEELAIVDCRSKNSFQGYKNIHNHKFFKSMFDKAQYLGQVDYKFLACLVPSTSESSDPDLLVLFDQHAVHERIRLEEFTKDLYSHKGAIRTTLLQPPLQLEVGSEYVRLARAFSSELEKIGLTVETETGSDSSNILYVRGVPTCLSEREASELKNSRPSILASLAQALLEEQLVKMKETGSVGGSISKTILNVLSSRACKGAIKFGHPLEKADCLQLIKHLSSCQLPFQCAHGRPSIIPIMEMADLHVRTSQWKTGPPRLFRLRRKTSKELI